MQLHPRISTALSLFAALKTVWPWLQSIYHDCRFQFVVGLSGKRFSHAEFIIEGRKDSRVAHDFRELELLLDYHMKRFRYPRINRALLLQMWCSRKLIRVGGKDEKIKIVTYWHY